MKTGPKEAWVARLENGTEKQIRGKLFNYLTPDGDGTSIRARSTGEIGACCLGVLTRCYIDDPETPDDVRVDGCVVEVLEGKDNWGHNVWIEVSTNLLPPAVTEWAGLDHDDPYIGNECATHLNDERGWSFENIAAQIRKADPR